MEELLNLIKVISSFMRIKTNKESLHAPIFYLKAKSFLSELKAKCVNCSIDSTEECFEVLYTLMSPAHTITTVLSKLSFSSMLMPRYDSTVRTGAWKALSDGIHCQFI